METTWHAWDASRRFPSSPPMERGGPGASPCCRVRVRMMRSGACLACIGSSVVEMVLDPRMRGLKDASLEMFSNRDREIAKRPRLPRTRVSLCVLHLEGHTDLARCHGGRHCPQRAVELRSPVAELQLTIPQWCPVAPRQRCSDTRRQTYQQEGQHRHPSYRMQNQAHGM